jgi:hypothetical protein
VEPPLLHGEAFEEDEAVLVEEGVPEGVEVGVQGWEGEVFLH